MSSYEPFTRKPVEYLPVVLNGQPIGYLWAGETDTAASFVRRLDTMNLAFEAPLVWLERLNAASEQGLPAREAIRRWIGAPQDPRGGAVPPGVAPQRADSASVVEQLANPNVPPTAGPLVQDGELPDGTPIDRSKGWGPLSVTLPPTYPAQTAGPVVYRAVVDENGLILGYLWASGDAASYVARPDAGLDGTNRAGRLLPALREAFERDVPAVEAIRSLAPDADEAHAPSLDDLIALASRYEQSLHLTFPLPDPARPPRPPLAPAERDAVLAYLDQAPVAFPAGAPVPDLEDAAGPAVVPSGYRTDGTWVWPEAVAYYLRVHGISPDVGLVSHIRANAGRVPEVSPESLNTAVRTLTANGVLSTPPI